MDLYRQRIDRDLDRWREKGWIEEQALGEIRADLDARSSSIRIGDIFALLGAVLLCLAAAAFVAANWTAIPRPAKLGLLVGALWLSYALAGVFWRRGAVFPAHAAALLGVGLFGADIMLIGQMYHMGGEPTGALLLWALGGLATGLVLRSTPVLVGAAGLFLLWSEWTAFDDWQVHWPVLIAWAAMAFAFWRSGWRGGFHVIALALLWFTLVLGFRLNSGEIFAPTIALGLVTMSIGAGLDLQPRWNAAFDGRGRALIVYGFLAAFAGLFFWQISEIANAHTRDVGGLVALGPYAAIGLGFLVLTVWFAAARNHSTLLWWSYAALTAELIMLYVSTLGTLLETAVFFLSAAALVGGLAWFAARIRPREPSGTIEEAVA